MRNGWLKGLTLLAALSVASCGSLNSTKGAAGFVSLPEYCAKVSGEPFYRCKVKLTFDNGKLALDHEPFKVPPDLPVVAVWILNQPDLYFAANDGIFISTPNGQFTDKCFSDDDGTCTSVAKPTRFKWKVLNSLPYFSSQYCVQFHDSQGVSHAFDPTIVNSLQFAPSSPPVAKAGGVCP